LHRPLSAREVESAVRSLISRGPGEPISAACSEAEAPPTAPAERIRPAPVPPDIPWLRLFHAMSRLRRSAPEPEAAAREITALVQTILAPEAVGVFYPAPRGDGGQWVRLAASSLSERGFEAIAAGPAALDERRFVIEIGPATRMVIQGLPEELRESAPGYTNDLEELLRDLFP
jgi:hypothetical protein